MRFGTESTSGPILYSPIAWGMRGRDPLVPFVQQFHHGFPGLRLALFDQFASADGTRIAFRFRMRWHNTGTFFGLPPTGAQGGHEEFHSLRIAGDQIVEQVVTDVSAWRPGSWLEVSSSRQATTVAGGDLEGDPRPVAPGPARGAPPVLFIAVRIVRVGLQEQPHEHRVHDVLLISPGRPPSAWVLAGPASLRPSRTGRGQSGCGDTRSMPRRPVGPVAPSGHSSARRGHSTRQAPSSDAPRRPGFLPFPQGPPASATARRRATLVNGAHLP